MRFEDLRGRTFGHLLVLSRADDYVSPTGKRTVCWLCRCDCGKEIIMLRNTLKSANSCGCVRAKKSRDSMLDLSGQRFGKWTVIRKAPLPRPDSNGTKTGWLCQCDCGTERIIRSRSLTHGSSLSCGCDTAAKATERLERDNVLGRHDGTVVSTISLDRKPNRNNQSGVKGVYWSSSEKRWVAKIGLRGKSITLGRFSSLEDAAAARRAAEIALYKPIIDKYKGD